MDSAKLFFSRRGMIRCQWDCYEEVIVLCSGIIVPPFYYDQTQDWFDMLGDYAKALEHAK